MARITTQGGNKCGIQNGNSKQSSAQAYTQALESCLNT